MIRHLLIAFCALLAVNSASAAEFTYNGINYETNGTNTVKVKYNSSYSGDIVIPDLFEYDGVTYTVTEIARAFDYCTGVTSVSIPNTVITIGSSSFSGCSSLQSVTIGNSVQMIGAGAFNGCSNLTAVTLPSTVVTIDNSAFQGCSQLTSINIPASVTTIGPNPFEGCSKLSQFTDASGSSDGRILVRNGVLISFAPYDSTNDTPLASYEIPNNVTSIEQNAFAGCSGLTSLIIPNEVRSIGERSFSGCSGLAGTLTLPSSMDFIGLEAFRGCTGLTGVVLPNSVTTVGNNPFMQCSNLAEFTGGLASDDGNFFTANGTLVSCAPAGDAECSIPDDVTEIGNYAFYSCTGLTSVYIPTTSVTSIGEFAFYQCSSLSAIVVPNSVTSIGRSAFRECTNLATAKISATLSSIDEYTFYNCKNMESVNIPKAITSIGKYAFNNCQKLTSIEIPLPVTSLGNNAFGYCTGLRSIKVFNPCQIEIPSNSNNAPFNKVYVSLCELWVPAGSKTVYEAANKWKDFKGTTSEGISFDNIKEFQYTTITEGADYTSTTDIPDVAVYYERTFSGSGFYAIYLPYEMKFEDWAGFGNMYEVNNVHQYDYDGDGVFERSTIEFAKIKKGSIMKHMPYVFRPRADYVSWPITFVTSKETVYAAPDSPGFVDCSSTKNTYTMTGTYEKMTGPFADNFYALSKEGKFVKAVATNPVLNPYRFYLEVTSRTAGSLSSLDMPGVITISIDGEIVGGDDTTDIINISTDLPQQQDDNYYDLMGRRVLNPGPGIYIHQCKKIYITK